MVVKMNWKGHITLGILMGLPFISSPEQIFLLVAGALYPDLDHDVKSEIVQRGLYISGGLILVSILAYLFRPEYFNTGFFIAAILSGVIYITPYYAEHRGITHTFLSLGVMSIILGYLTFKLSVISPIMASLIALIMVTNNKLLGKSVAISVFAWVLYNMISTSFTTSQGLEFYIIPIAIGYLSHLVGDCMTPMGCRTLYPLNYTFHKKEGYFAIAIWVLLVFYVIKLA